MSILILIKKLFSLQQLIVLISIIYLIITFIALETEILLLLTILLIIFNYIFSLTYLFRQGKVTVAIVLLNIVQLILFCRLHVLIYNILGTEHYIYSELPNWYDWLELVLVHVLRAVDIVDAINAYGFQLQNIQHQSTLTGIILFSMHIMVDIFLLGAIFITANKPNKTNSFFERLKIQFSIQMQLIKDKIVYVIIGIIIVFMIFFYHNSPDINWLLWPLDNLLRTLDFGDAFHIFDWQLHDLDKTFMLATLAVMFRVIVGFYALKITNRIILKLLQGKGKTLDKLTAICILDKHSEEEADIAFQALIKFESITPNLVNILINGKFHFRRLAAEQLGDLDSVNTTEVVPYLIAALFDGDKDVRQAANTTLQKIIPQWQQYINAAVPHIIDKILLLDTLERKNSAIILKMKPIIVNKTLVPLGNTLFTSNSSYTCKAVIEILDTLGKISKPVIYSLVKALVHKDEEVQLAAEDALYNIDPEWQTSKNINKAIPFLVKALFDSNTSCSAKKNLKVVNLRALPTKYTYLSILYIITALQDKEANIRRAAIEIIDEFGVKAAIAVPHLQKLYNNDWQVGSAAGRVLEHILNNINPNQALLSKNDDIRYAGILSLVNYATTQDIPCLLIATKDNKSLIRNLAIQVLNRIDPTEKLRRNIKT